MDAQYFLKISFNSVESNINMEVLEFDKTDLQGQLSNCYRALDCTNIDIIPFSNKIDFIVDDEGLLASGNPVFKIPSVLYMEDLHIAGDFLVATKKISPQGIKNIAGFNNIKEIQDVVSQLKITLVGIVN